MIHAERGGHGPLLVLLHGLGATAEVWSGVTRHWPGSWLAVDLPGHGRSTPLERYSFGSLAAAVAQVVPAGPVYVLGHSLGGVVALTLAGGWFGTDVRAAAGVGIKLNWSDDDLAKANAIAGKPAKLFPTADEATAWASKLAGTPLAHGVTETPDGWRAALDMAAFGVGAPDIPGLLTAAKAPVTLAAGESDHMCPPADLKAATPDGIVLAGVGHNAHVEQPESIKPVLDRLLLG